ncbi:hypothetical protein SUBVAR_06275 [Subdoligranulum variabile DSM 15176]|uniref:Uncharacterized protein n=1 Tax=Subdoligranulum variabile DSM 15176 TaxID=411471 RepID=D1PPG0_9FIRM|nr:hypothetical protein SUBVAR_06275 [Subdoligranulum variabile DSM 15176]
MCLPPGRRTPLFLPFDQKNQKNAKNHEILNRRCFDESKKIKAVKKLFYNKFRKRLDFLVLL